MSESEANECYLSIRTINSKISMYFSEAKLKLRQSWFLVLATELHLVFTAQSSLTRNLTIFMQLLTVCMPFVDDLFRQSAPPACRRKTIYFAANTSFCGLKILEISQ
jgi:hypothetical protein